MSTKGPPFEQKAATDTDAAEDGSDLRAAPQNRHLIVDLDGFQGPLDLLLNLAREQKLDIIHINILALAEQYIAFIKNAAALKLDIAADYLVMAAWLTYLKSRALLPDPPADDEAEPTAEELARHLAHRLARLQAMRDAAAALMNRPRLNRDIFARGLPETIRTTTKVQYTNDLYDLLKAYTHRRNAEAPRQVLIKKRNVWSIKQARFRLEELLGLSLAWAPIDHLLITLALTPEEQRTALASTFVASLEMAREGNISLRQSEPFGPLFVKKT